jgi:hypothetical protein
VPGEKRSFMDALVDAGLDVYAVDMRGYGATPRDASGWLTPDRAVADVHAVIAWIQQRTPCRVAAADLPLWPVARRDGGGDGGAAEAGDACRRGAARVRVRPRRLGAAHRRAGAPAASRQYQRCRPPPTS